MIISDNNNSITSQKNIKYSTSKEENIKEPKDSVILQPFYMKGDNNILSYPSERIEKTREHMEKAGFEFNNCGRTGAIIYSSGGARLIDAEKIISKYGGKITGTLWLIDAFTAEITPEAYLYLFEKMPNYRPVPDPEYKKLIKLPAACQNPQQALLNFADFLGIE